MSSSSTTSSVVTLQDFPPASAERIDCAASGASSLSNSESKSNPIAVPSTATWIHSDSHPSLYSSLNAATNRHPGQLSLDLDNMSLENTLGSGFTPNQNALQHARLQLAGKVQRLVYGKLFKLSSDNLNQEDIILPSFHAVYFVVHCIIDYCFSPRLESLFRSARTSYYLVGYLIKSCQYHFQI